LYNRIDLSPYFAYSLRFFIEHMKQAKPTPERFPQGNYETMKLLSIYEPFLKDVAKIRARIGVPEGGFLEWTEGMVWDARFKIERTDTFLEYRRVIKKVLRRYRLPDTLIVAVQTFIRTGQVHVPQLLGYDVTPVFDGETTKVEVLVHQKLTKKDEVELLREIREYALPSAAGMRRTKRSRARMNIDRDIAILRGGAGTVKTKADIRLMDDIFDINLEDEDLDISTDGDRRRLQVMRQARRRLRLLLKKTFG